MARHLFTHLTLLAPGHPLHRQSVDIRVVAGVLEDLVPAGGLAPEAADTHHHQPGWAVSAGWVDSWCVLNDPGQEARDTLDTLSQSALQGGFSHLVTLPNTEPTLDNAQYVRALLARAASLPVHLHPMGAATVSCAGKAPAELVEMGQAGAVAFSDGLQPLQNAGVLMRTLQYLALNNGLLVQMPLNTAAEGGGQANESPAVARLGLKPSPALAEVLMVATCIELLRYCGGRLHLCPISSAQALSLIRQAKAEGLQLTAATCPQYLLLTDDTLTDFDPVYKMRPPLRTAADAQALRAALADGTLDVLAAGHAPATVDEKRLEFDYATFGAPALETAFAASYTALGPAHLDALISALTNAPRALFGLPPVSWQPSQAIDLTFVDLEAAWTPCPSDIKSPHRISPYMGMPLKGRVMGTLTKGQWTAVRL